MPEVPVRLVREATSAAPPRYAPPDDPARQSPHPLLRGNLRERCNVADGYIAGTAASRGLMVATCDARPFEAAGVNTVNPWETSP